MQTENFTFKVFKADEGKWLTEKNDAVEVKERSFSKVVYQAADNNTEWVECDDEYKEYIESKKKELMEKEMNEALSNE
jgi:hypothetical protein